MSGPSMTRWPAESRPEGAPVYTWNAIDVAAPPERVWAWLVRATRWPEYYDNASNIRFDAAGNYTGSFGKITQSFPARQIQFALKLLF